MAYVVVTVQRQWFSSQQRSSIRSKKVQLEMKRTVCVVLGEMLINNGKASPNLRMRVRTAADAVKQYKASDIIMSGGDTARVNQTEASVMKQLWENNYDHDGTRDGVDGVFATRLHLEEFSLTTCQNAFYSIPILKRIGADRIVLVTSDFHAPRAKLLFEQVFRTYAADLLDIELIDFVAPTARDKNRISLFENERYRLQPDPLARSLTNMTDHPFILPTGTRVQQARQELEELEI